MFFFNNWIIIIEICFKLEISTNFCKYIRCYFIFNSSLCNLCVR